MTVAVPGDLECRELVELVTAWLEGSLAREDRMRLELHLAVCPACSAHVRQVRATLRAASGPPAALPPETRERLLEAFRALRRSWPPA